MSDQLKAQAGQIILVFLVFLLFAANGSGILDFQFRADSGFALRSILWSSIPGQGIVLPEVVHSTEFISLLTIGLLLSVLLPVLNPIQASLLTACVAIIPLFIAYTATSRSHLPLEYSLLTILMLYAINVLIGYFRETMMKQKIVDVFGQFIPPELVAEISKHPDKMNLEGEAKYMTVFFCDLQNFTGVAEQLNPKQLALLLNEYFNVMTEILYSHGATIDKYIGDSIMAFWSAPVAQEDHAQRAVLASLDMQKEILILSETFKKRGWPGPSMGIGMNSGTMSVGNMGSKYRITYTVVGDAVNLASRLETLTRTYRVPTIVSESTMNESPDVLFRSLDLVQVKGKHNKTKIFEPLCRIEEANDELRRKVKEHEAVMEMYFSDNPIDAKPGLEKLLAENKDDPLYPELLDKITKASG